MEMAGARSEHFPLKSTSREATATSSVVCDLEEHEDTQQQQQSPPKPSKSRRGCRIKYNHLAWTIIVITTAITVIDRFTINLWPLWVNSPGPLRDHWSVSAFIAFSWMSGRILLVSTNVAFMTQCRVFWNWIAEKAPAWLDCGDIHQINNNIHYHNSWFLIGVVTVLHCWTIFLPWAAGVQLKVFSSWWRPSDPKTGKRMGFYANKIVSLSVNDVYRLVGMSVAFFLLFPASRLCLHKSFTLSMFIHLLAAAMFTIDLVRMKSHPHCWVFNCPIILWWMIDRLYGIWYYRRYAPYIVQRVDLEDYLVLFLRSKHKHTRELGDVYYLNSLETHSYHRAHPFTTFSNHTGKLMTTRVSAAIDYHDPVHKFRMLSLTHDDIFAKELIREETQMEYEQSFSSFMSETALAEKLDDPRNTPSPDWDTAVIMKVYEEGSWSKKIAQAADDMLHTIRMWGPYRSEYREMPADIEEGIPVVLIGTGAGACYLIDFQQWVLANNIELKAPVEIYYSSRSVGLFQFVSDMLNIGNGIRNLKMNIHFTSNPDVKYDPNEKKALDARIGRSSLEEILSKCEKNTVVYFCGAPEVQEKVVRLCRRRGLIARLGHAFH